MVGYIHIKLLVVRHGPDDAELVLQVVPEPAVSLILFDPALEAIGAMSEHVSNVHAETLQDLLARPGKLLDGVHDCYLVLDVQIINQRDIGLLMDSRLKSAQVDRHSIRLLMIERCKHALPGCHGFLMFHRTALPNGLEGST